jgi:hypothetical protein
VADEDLDPFKASYELDHVQLALSLLEKAGMVTLQGTLTDRMSLIEVRTLAEKIKDADLKDFVEGLLSF